MANARTLRERVRAHQLRQSLVVELGGVCANCGDPTTPLLEIDHVEGRTWKAEETSQLQRAKLYWREYRSGVQLRCLCRSCNARDGGGRRYA